ncbi:acyl carrier protein [Actinokineospora sp.]|uniref:acyl carrier protein n=1 Tax=Actinokineospora sp. TaxID=1872133 RepID=UPI00403833E8
MPVPLDTIIGTVTELVAKEFGTPRSGLTPDLDLSTVEGADSVKVLRVVAKIERAYDIELEDDEVFGFKTIRDVATSVESTLAAR